MSVTRQLAVLSISGVGCVAWLGLFRSIAVPLGLVDHPGGRKRHDLPMPVVGGLAMFLGMLPVLFAGGHGALVNLGLAMLLVVVVGVVDDKATIPAKTRLTLEALAALILVAGGVSLRHLGDLVGGGPIGTSLAAPLITVVCVTGTINAMNMADGLDGLAGSLALVAIAFFTAVALADGDLQLVKVGCAALGAIAGFLAFNLRTRFRSRAAVFMGDAGSMLLGLVIAWFAITLAGQRPSLLTPIGAVWIMAVPLCDMGSVMLHRMQRGQSPFAADRRHLHYLLVDAGMSVSEAVGLLVLAGVACGAIGVALPLLGVPEWLLFAAFLGTWAIVYRAMDRHFHGIAAGQPAVAAIVRRKLAEK